MPVQTSPPAVPDSFPSFMSVFGGCSPSFPEKDENGLNKTLRPPTTNVSLSSKHRLPFPHRESVSTTGSTESSPTTTISTFDSNSVADTSASSSPESPLSMPVAYPKFMPPARNVESLSMSVAQDGVPRRASDAPMQKRQHSPGRRDRNLKNLSLRMPPSSQCRPPIATASVVETTSQHHLSAPPSPVHIPPRSSRRKPANLTIQTPAFDKSFSSSITEIGSAQHSLRHAESSPSLFSPSFGPKGGMQLHRSMTHHGARNLSTSETNPSPRQTTDKGTCTEDTLHEMDEEDLLNTSESSHRNDRGYPDGPIQIFDTGVYLYLEPTIQEASGFDVIVNVASEVDNPFADTGKQTETIVSTWRNTSRDAQRVSNSEPQTAVSEGSFKSAFEYPRSETPSSKSEQSTPEYIHVGWGHNSEILDDLYPLCELIDSRVSQGKKVLVHCQLGVSRSASLVIAYGLYKHRDLDFNTIYGMVKERSCWVGPNMSLIYQLTDFRSRLLRGSPAKSAPEEWFVNLARGRSEPQPDCAPTPVQSTPSADAVSSAGLDSTSQAPSGLSALTSDTSTERPSVMRRLSHKRSLSPRQLPLRQRVRSFAPACKQFKSESNLRRRADVPSLETTDIPMLDMDVPELPSLFSPRTNTFMAGAPAAPTLPQNGPGSPLFSPQIADPRSPHQGNERLIMRNIDELL